MSGRRRSFSRPLSLVALLSLSLLPSFGLSACKEDSSNLEAMAKQGDKPDKAGSGSTPEVAPKPSEPEAPDPDKPLTPDVPPVDLPLDGDGLPIPPLDGAATLLSPGADEDRIELRLGLAVDARYRVTTIGMLKLPLFDKPTGFAREEDLTLSDCQGEAAARSCLLSHVYRNFEAEPPTGDALAKDEAIVAKLATSHRIDASGLRQTTTEITGEIENPSAEALSQIHLLYCIRLPSEPVGVGATWRDVCRTRLGGQNITRQLVWRLLSVEKGPDGTRAEIEYAGRVSRIDSEGIGTGEVKGKLFFWVDAGEPHMMLERVVFIIDAQRGLSTGTDLRYQFVKLGEGDTLLRTDGKPFEADPTVLNEVGEALEGDAKPKSKPKGPE